MPSPSFFKTEVVIPEKHKLSLTQQEFATLHRFDCPRLKIFQIYFYIFNRNRFISIEVFERKHMKTSKKNSELCFSVFIRDF